MLNVYSNGVRSINRTKSTKTTSFLQVFFIFLNKSLDLETPIFRCYIHKSSVGAIKWMNHRCKWGKQKPRSTGKTKALSYLFLNNYLHKIWRAALIINTVVLNYTNFCFRKMQCASAPLTVWLAGLLECCVYVSLAVRVCQANSKAAAQNHRPFPSLEEEQWTQAP